MHRQDFHVDPAEAQEVVRLAAERQSAVPDSGPTVNGLAEALGLPREEIERLLTEVRQRGVAATPVRRRIFGDRSAALSAALALVLFLVSAGGLLLFRAQASAPRMETVATATLGPGFDTDVIVPPMIAPSPPAIAEPEEVVVESREEAKRQEIARLAEEIARLQAERSKASIDQTLNELRKELERLKKVRASEGQ